MSYNSKLRRKYEQTSRDSQIVWLHQSERRCASESKSTSMERERWMCQKSPSSRGETFLFDPALKLQSWSDRFVAKSSRCLPSQGHFSDWQMVAQIVESQILSPCTQPSPENSTTKQCLKKLRVDSILSKSNAKFTSNDSAEHFEPHVPKKMCWAIGSIKHMIQEKKKDQLRTPHRLIFVFICQGSTSRTRKFLFRREVNSGSPYPQMEVCSIKEVERAICMTGLGLSCLVFVGSLVKHEIWDATFSKVLMHLVSEQFRTKIQFAEELSSQSRRHVIDEKTGCSPAYQVQRYIGTGDGTPRILNSELRKDDVKMFHRSWLAILLAMMAQPDETFEEHL